MRKTDDDFQLMTLEEFIVYFEEQSKEHTNLVPYDVDEKYNRNCKQLAKWLRELKAYRESKKEITRKMNSGQWSEGVVYGLDKAIRIMEKI